jgi:O-antigen/teichoic acid export membrane protein
VDLTRSQRGPSRRRVLVVQLAPGIASLVAVGLVISALAVGGGYAGWAVGGAAVLLVATIALRRYRRFRVADLLDATPRAAVDSTRQIRRMKRVAITYTTMFVVLAIGFGVAGLVPSDSVPAWSWFVAAIVFLVIAVAIGITFTVLFRRLRGRPAGGATPPVE